MRGSWRQCTVFLLLLTAGVGVVHAEESETAFSYSTGNRHFIGMGLAFLDLEYRIVIGASELGVGTLSLARLPGLLASSPSTYEGLTGAEFGARLFWLLRPFQNSAVPPLRSLGVGAAGIVRASRSGGGPSVHPPEAAPYSTLVAGVLPILDWGFVVRERWRFTFTTALTLFPRGVFYVWPYAVTDEFAAPLEGWTYVFNGYGGATFGVTW